MFARLRPCSISSPVQPSLLRPVVTSHTHHRARSPKTEHKQDEAEQTVSQRMRELKTVQDSRKSAIVTPTTPVPTRPRLAHCKPAGNVLEVGHTAERDGETASPQIQP
eukprot:1989276-Pyramimonas_sp.AAC.1